MLNLADMDPNYWFIVCLSLTVSHCYGQNLDLYSEMLEMRNEITRLNERLDRQDTELNDLRGRVEHCEVYLWQNKTHIDKMKRLLLGGQSEFSDNKVAFYAHLSRNIDSLGNHQPIVFDTVKTNQGNAYKSVDGEFVAQVAGTYFFIWTISNGDHTYMQSELVVNGHVFGQVIADSGSHNDWAVSTAFTIVTLRPDDRVWIRSGTVHSGHVSGEGFGTSSFAGFLLW